MQCIKIKVCKRTEAIKTREKYTDSMTQAFSIFVTLKEVAYKKNGF